MQAATVSQRSFETERSSRARLRVLLDARKLGDGGIGRYTQNLMTGLLDTDEIELTVLCRSDISDTFTGVCCLIDSAKSYSLDEYLLLAKRIDWSAFDLYHNPHYTLPFGIPIPSIVTVHDLIHVEQPQKWFYPLIASKLIRSSLYRSSAVLTVSQASRDSIERFYPRSKNKVTVIPNANSQTLDSPVRISPDVQEPYILSIISTDKPHKGLQDLLDAFAQAKKIASKLGARFARAKLCVVGQGVVKDTSRLSGDVVFKGAVSEQELSKLYQGALTLIIPSTIEGFCLPALEAKMMGVPVITRPVPAVCELMSTGDRVCADMSVDSLGNEILAALSGALPKSVLPDRGSLEKFSIRSTTEQVVRIYQGVAGV